MVTKIQRWGNSQGFRISKNLLADAKLDIGDEVSISVKGGIMIVAPAKRKLRRQNLKDLVARIPEGYQPGEVDWGKPVAKNEW